MAEASRQQTIQDVGNFIHAVNLATDGALRGPQTVFDLGARDLSESLMFSRSLDPGSKIYAFECNETTLTVCRKRVPEAHNVTLVEKAVCDYDGEAKFYPIDADKTVTDWPDGNPGASSLYIANGKYTQEVYVQKETSVPCTRIDTFCRHNGIAKIDVIWADIQGAEMLALKGAGSLLEGVKAIHTELSHQPIYEGQCVSDEVHELLTFHGFVLLNPWVMVTRGAWQVDAMYVKRDLIKT